MKFKQRPKGKRRIVFWSWGEAGTAKILGGLKLPVMFVLLHREHGNCT